MSVQDPNYLLGGREPEPLALTRQLRPLPVPSGTKQELTWGQLFELLKRNILLSCGVMCLVMLAVTVGTLMMRPQYEAAAEVEIDPPTSEFSFQSSNVPPNDPDYLETQIQILRSEALGIDVIRKLHLDTNPDFVPQGPAKPGFLHRLRDKIHELLPNRNRDGVPASGDPGGPTLTADEKAALSVYARSLQVVMTRNSNVVSVNFLAPNPWLAAKIANTLADDYIEQHYRTRYETAMSETGWLSKELDDLHEKVETSNRALAQFQNRNGIVDLNEKENTTTETVAQLTQQLNAARGERIQLEADVRTMSEAGPDALPQMRNNNLIQDLSKMLAEASANLAQSAAIYGENNANVRKYRNQVNDLQTALNAERNRISTSVRASYRSALTREHLLVRALDRMKGQIHEMNATEVMNSSLKKQLQVNEDLYNTLFTKLKEAGIAAGLRSGAIRIVDHARVPDAPATPKVSLNLALGLVLSVVLAIGVPIVKEILTNRVHVPEDVRKATGLPPIGVLPLLKPYPAPSLLSYARRELPSAAADSRGENSPLANWIFPPNSAGAEAVRNLCTSIVLSTRQTPPRIILLTSAVPGEGKTTVAVRLATVLAESKPTCLVDCDLRRPAVGRALGVNVRTGLCSVLSGEPLHSAIYDIPGLENMAVLPAGLASQNPGEQISSEAMREVLREVSTQFQYVVIDSPPILPFADGRIISRMVDGVLLVGRSGLTTTADLHEALEVLHEVHAPVLGVILNGLNKNSSYYRRYQMPFAYAAET